MPCSLFLPGPLAKKRLICGARDRVGEMAEGQLTLTLGRQEAHLGTAWDSDASRGQGAGRCQGAPGKP